MKAYLAAGAYAIASVTSVASAHAEVVLLEDDFFVVRHAATVSATRDQAWDVLLSPSAWWNEEHSFSGDAENFYLEAEAGGCFCEVLPSTDDRRVAGSVRHLEVVLIDPPSTLRLTGALGPLQGEPVEGVLTIKVEAVDEGTQVVFEYAVGGPSRLRTDRIAPAVDAVIGNQLARLAASLQGGTNAGARQSEEAANRPPLAREYRPSSSIEIIEPDDKMPEPAIQQEEGLESLAPDSIGEDFLSGGNG